MICVDCVVLYLQLYKAISIHFMYSVNLKYLGSNLAYIRGVKSKWEGLQEFGDYPKATEKT